VPGALGHILVASFISLPAAILVARLMVPGDSTTPAESHNAVAYRSSMDAIARGTEDGLKLYLGIVAMLLVMVALVALVNTMMSGLPMMNGAPSRSNASSVGYSFRSSGFTGFRPAKQRTQVRCSARRPSSMNSLPTSSLQPFPMMC